MAIRLVRSASLRMDKKLDQADTVFKDVRYRYESWGKIGSCFV
jgi:hypothetical protein